MKKNVFAALALVAAAGFSVNASAQTATASFSVKMTIAKACSVTAGAASDISLGTAVLSTAVNQTGNGTISVTCSKTTAYKIGLLPQTAGGTANGTGFMVSTTAPTVNTDKVPYTLYSDNAYSTVWGNANPGNVVSSPVGGGTGTAQSYVVYAKNTNANFTPDSYADTVSVTVTY
jgi:spore coat protein U-like protein